jgi:hypothetical protein
MTVWHMRDLDVVFISYDEACADENYRWLAEHTVRAPIRVHGVKGFHNAYLKAAEAAVTPRFITVDGDNRVRAPGFFTQSVDDRSLKDIVFSFNSRNSINGLIYGNGGIKCWPKELLAHVNTHENSSGGLNAIDFNHVCRYYSVGFLASDTICGATPYHAFRAAYREAVKLSCTGKESAETWHENLRNLKSPVLNWLKIWLSVGLDAPNGIWSILGARVGLIDYWRGSFPLESLADYAYFDSLWAVYRDADDSDALLMANELSSALHVMQINSPILDHEVSEWFKNVIFQPTFAGAFDRTKPSPLP